MGDLNWRVLGNVVCIFTALSGLPFTALAQKDTHALRQRGLRFILGGMKPDMVRDLRSNCVAGDPVMGSPMLVNASAAGFALSPAELCITILTRAARDGNLMYLHLEGGKTTPALALDAGFVAAWKKREPVAGLPSMAALKPAAERCIAQTATDTDLCHAVGYAYGARAAQGETIAA